MMKIMFITAFLGGIAALAVGFLVLIVLIFVNHHLEELKIKRTGKEIRR